MKFLQKIWVILVMIGPSIVIGLEKAITNTPALNRFGRRNNVTWSYKLPPVCIKVAKTIVTICGIVVLGFSAGVLMNVLKPASTGIIMSAFAAGAMSINKKMFTRKFEHLVVSYIPNVDKDRNLKAGEPAGRFKLVHVKEGTCRACELEGVNRNTFAYFSYIECGFEAEGVPVFIWLKINGEDVKYVLTCFTNGGGKKGQAIYTEEKFYVEHQELHMEQYFNGPCKSQELREENAWLMYQVKTLPVGKEWSEARKVLTEKELILKALAGKERSERDLVNEKRPVSKANQAIALLFTPSEEIGCRLTPNDVAIIPDVVVEKLEGVNKQLDVLTFVLKAIEKASGKPTDGVSFIAEHTAERLGIYLGVGVHQIRSNSGSLKGTLVIVPDEIMPNCTIKDVFGNDVDLYDKYVIFETVAKDIKVYSSIEEFCKKDQTIRLMQKKVHLKGTISLSRQAFQSFMWKATREEIRSVAMRDIVKLVKLRTRIGYINKCYDICPMLKHRVFAPMILSGLFLRSVAKEIWSAIYAAASATVTVRGGSLVNLPDMNYVFNKLDGGNRPTLAPKTCRVDKRSGLKEGDEIVVIRYPQINPVPLVLKVVGYTDYRNAIEVCAYDGTMLHVDADSDGDDLDFIADEICIRAAKRAIEFCKECGLDGEWYYEDVPASLEAKCADLADYLYATSTMGNVGQATMPIFALMSLIDIDAKPDDIVTIAGHDLCVRDILWLACKVKINVTLKADSGKRMADSAFLDTEDGKILADICRDYCAFSEHFDHPFECKLKKVNGKYRYWKEQWETSKNPTGTKTPIGKTFANSCMVVVHDIVMEEISGKANKIFEEYVDVLDGYKAYDSESQAYYKTKGFVKIPSGEGDEKYHGIPMDVWRLNTGIKKLEDKKNSSIILKFEGYDAKESIIVNDMEILGKDFREFVLNGLPELTDDTPYEEEDYALNLANNKFTKNLSVGLLAHRMRQVMFRIERDLSDDPRKKVEVRNDVEEHIENVVKAIIYHVYKIVITDEQARTIAYNEQARYLFSEHANEANGADIQAFFNEFAYEISEATGIWPKTK